MEKQQTEMEIVYTAMEVDLRDEIPLKPTAEDQILKLTKRVHKSEWILGFIIVMSIWLQLLSLLEAVHNHNYVISWLNDIEVKLARFELTIYN